MVWFSTFLLSTEKLPIYHNPLDSKIFFFTKWKASVILIFLNRPTTRTNLRTQIHRVIYRTTPNKICFARCLEKYPFKHRQSFLRKSSGRRHRTRKKGMGMRWARWIGFNILFSFETYLWESASRYHKVWSSYRCTPGKCDFQRFGTAPCCPYPLHFS